PLLVERVTGVVGPGGELRPGDDTTGPTLQSGRTLEERAEDAVTDRDVVGHHIELGEAPLREVDLLRVAHPHRVPRDLQLGRGGLGAPSSPPSRSLRSLRPPAPRCSPAVGTAIRRPYRPARCRGRAGLGRTFVRRWSHPARTWVAPARPG